MLESAPGGADRGSFEGFCCATAQRPKANVAAIVKIVFFTRSLLSPNPSAVAAEAIGLRTGAHSMDRLLRVGAQSGKSCISGLDIEDTVGRRGLLRLKKRDGHIVHRNSSSGGATESSVVGMAVHDEIGTVAIDHFSQPGAS